jgi:hypothetical protein
MSVLEIGSVGPMLKVPQDCHKVPPPKVAPKQLLDISFLLAVRVRKAFERAFRFCEKGKAFSFGYNGKVFKGEMFVYPTLTGDFVVSNPRTGIVVTILNCGTRRGSPFTDGESFALKVSPDGVNVFSVLDGPRMKEKIGEDLRGIAKTVSVLGVDREVEGIDRNAYLATFAIIELMEASKNWPGAKDFDTYLARLPFYKAGKFIDWLWKRRQKGPKSGSETLPLIMDVGGGRGRMLQALVGLPGFCDLPKEAFVLFDLVPPCGIKEERIVLTAGNLYDPVPEDGPYGRAWITVCHDVFCILPDIPRALSAVWDRTRRGGYGFIGLAFYWDVNSLALFCKEGSLIRAEKRFKQEIRRMAVCLSQRGYAVQGSEQGIAFHKNRERLVVPGRLVFRSPGHVWFSVE